MIRSTVSTCFLASSICIPITVLSLVGTMLDYSRSLPRATEAEVGLENEFVATRDPESEQLQEGVAVIVPTKGNEVKGLVRLYSSRGEVEIQGRIEGLSPGKHGFHIHEFGDLRDPEGQTAGGHYDPEGNPHGSPDSPRHHAGDLGNIEANEQGVAEFRMRSKVLELPKIVGRALVVHKDADDLESQPSGDAGDRVGIGVIGWAFTAEEDQKNR